MLAVIAAEPGGTEFLHVEHVSDPVPGPGEVLIDVAATAVNRADLLQRRGFYDPPPGASTIMGMECSGTVSGLGEGVTSWHVGDQVCALLAGGGYAAKVAAPATQLMPIPAGVSLADAAALPEVACTVWSNLIMTAGLSAGQVLLIHGGASGIGTMAIQVGKAVGATVAVTASRESSLAACRDLGADITINYADQDFVEAIKDATGGHGADVILDLVGAKYLQRNISALALGGKLIIIGLQGGTKAELDIGAMLSGRKSVLATALRSRPLTGPGSKAEIVAAVTEHLWPLIAAGQVRPVIDRILPLTGVATAHDAMEAGGHLGKIVMTIGSPTRADASELQPNGIQE